MTDKQQPDAFCWATELAMVRDPVTLTVKEAREVSDEMQRMHAELERLALYKSLADEYGLSIFPDIAEMTAELETLRTGYAAARLEIESLKSQSAAQQLDIENLRRALRFYADGEHFIKSDDNTWDTVSGEPQNYWCDEAGTATVEDGSIARLALSGQSVQFEDDTPQSAQPGAALSTLFREALAWGMAYGPVIPAHQWDEMRESMVKHYADRAVRAAPHSLREHSSPARLLLKQLRKKP